ncbi:hypothetical protein TWF730_002844 [Orbilia blumenaviensis]|uniref:Uncharacterized protein n=1 Tax=Orbilia blumenaviensis TaxID=1796055 RepID=A0AAV9U7A4_9PEZI
MGIGDHVIDPEWNQDQEFSPGNAIEHAMLETGITRDELWIQFILPWDELECVTAASLHEYFWTAISTAMSILHIEKLGGINQPNPLAASDPGNVYIDCVTIPAATSCVENIELAYFTLSKIVSANQSIKHIGVQNISMAQLTELLKVCDSPLSSVIKPSVVGNKISPMDSSHWKLRAVCWSRNIVHQLLCDSDKKDIQFWKKLLGGHYKDVMRCARHMRVAVTGLLFGMLISCGKTSIIYRDLSGNFGAKLLEEVARAKKWEERIRGYRFESAVLEVARLLRQACGYSRELQLLSNTPKEVAVLESCGNFMGGVMPQQYNTVASKLVDQKNHGASRHLTVAGGYDTHPENVYNVYSPPTVDIFNPSLPDLPPNYSKSLLDPEALVFKPSYEQDPVSQPDTEATKPLTQKEEPEHDNSHNLFAPEGLGLIRVLGAINQRLHV